MSANKNGTQVSCIEYFEHWLDLDLSLVKISISSNFEWSLFTIIALACSGHHRQQLALLGKSAALWVNEVIHCFRRYMGIAWHSSTSCSLSACAFCMDPQLVVDLGAPKHFWLYKLLVQVHRRALCTEASAPPAAMLFQSPEQWALYWDQMSWTPTARPLTGLGAFAESNKCGNFESSSKTYVVVPYIPVAQIRKTTFFAPLLWWFDCILGRFQLHDEDMSAGIRPVMQEVARPFQLQCCVEYPKLKYEELGRQVYPAGCGVWCQSS